MRLLSTGDPKFSCRAGPPNQIAHARLNLTGKYDYPSRKRKQQNHIPFAADAGDLNRLGQKLGKSSALPLGLKCSTLPSSSHPCSIFIASSSFNAWKNAMLHRAYDSVTSTHLFCLREPLSAALQMPLSCRSDILLLGELEALPWISDTLLAQDIGANDVVASGCVSVLGSVYWPLEGGRTPKALLGEPCAPRNPRPLILSKTRCLS